MVEIQRLRVGRPGRLKLVWAGATGLEPAASGVTGRRSNQLNYAPARVGVYQNGLFFSNAGPLFGGGRIGVRSSDSRFGM